ncbi:hypothetical protein BH23ACT3_BH23ACT3_05060 [soil metagenome]
MRGVISAVGVRDVPATLVHLGAVWGSEQVVLPATDTSPPVSEWGAIEIAVDIWHHAVYATATAVAFRRLSQQ